MTKEKLEKARLARRTASQSERGELLAKVKSEVLSVSINDIHVLDDIQPRLVKLDSRRVDEFAELYKEKGHVIPPIVVMNIGGLLVVVDGHHRLAGAVKAKLKSLGVHIIEGTFKDAQIKAIELNGNHGKPLTREEKRKAVKFLLENLDVPKGNYRAIGRKVGCSDFLVRTIQDELRDGTFEIKKKTARKTQQKGNRNYDDKSNNSNKNTELVDQVPNSELKSHENLSADSSVQQTSEDVTNKYELVKKRGQEYNDAVKDWLAEEAQSDETNHEFQGEIVSLAKETQLLSGSFIKFVANKYVDFIAEDLLVAPIELRPILESSISADLAQNIVVKLDSLEKIAGENIAQ